MFLLLDVPADAEWLAASGDFVAVGQIVAVAGVPGARVDFAAPASGWLVRSEDGMAVSDVCGSCGAERIGSRHWVHCPDRALVPVEPVVD
jgi:hypothetical protein